MSNAAPEDCPLRVLYSSESATVSAQHPKGDPTVRATNANDSAVAASGDAPDGHGDASAHEAAARATNSEGTAASDAVANGWERGAPPAAVGGTLPDGEAPGGVPQPTTSATILDHLCGLQFRVSPTAFFQVCHGYTTMRALRGVHGSCYNRSRSSTECCHKVGEVRPCQASSSGGSSCHANALKVVRCCCYDTAE